MESAVQDSRPRKRSSQQGGNERPGESKKPKIKTAETTKDDLEDGANISIQVEEVTLLSQQYISTETQEGLPCCIQSLLRRDRKVRQGEPDGNLLKAGSERSSKTINVEFTGTSTEDPATEFHQKMCDDKKAYVLRYREKEDDYYLKVKKSGGVNLRKLVNFPTDDKYFFIIQRIDTTTSAIQSLKKRGWYLRCSDLGEVCMTEETTGDNGTPKDLQTWFEFMRKEHVVQYQNFSVTYAKTECDFSDPEDPGNAVAEKNSEEAQNENEENPEVGNSEAPGEDDCNSPRTGKSQGAAEATPEDQKEENSGEL